NAPEGNGRFLIFSITNATAPVLNNAGQVVFWASLQNTSGGTFDDTGIYMYDGVGLKNLVREDGAAPGGANFDVLSDIPSVNDAGIVSFYSSLRNAQNGIDNAGTYLNNGSELVKIARRGDLLPDGNGQFSQSLGSDAVNSAGHVRIKAELINTSLGVNNNLGLYLYNGSSLVKLARENDAVPEGNGLFDDFMDFNQGFDDGDLVAFHATLRNTSGGSNDNSGIYLHNGTALVKLARENESAPDGNGLFSAFSPSALVNSAGQVAFRADLRNTSGTTLDNSGIYLHNGSSLVKLARENENVPEGDGRFDDFGFPAVNDAGQAAFYGYLRNTNSQTDSGIYLHNGSALKKLVRENDNVPEGNGRFDNFSRLQLNGTGQVAFKAFLRGNSGGLTDDNGIYVTDGIETVKVAREGDTLVGAVVAFLDTTGGYAGDAGLRMSFNDYGQVAFRAAAANGSQGLFLYTPDLRWRSTTSGSWDAAGNWTLSLKPGTPHAVQIDPSTSLSITGPAVGATVSTLTVGDDVGVAQPVLNLQAGSVVSASAAITLKDNATIGFQIGGTSTTDFARLMTAGIATLDGEVAVQFVNGFLPSAGDMFSILSATGGVAGTFDTTAAQLPALAGGLKWQINYGPNDVVLAVVAAGLSGDYNGNQVIDAADYTVWRDAVAAGATTLLNDFTPGVVDDNDYLYWTSHFGDSLGSGAGSGSTTVPEPTSLVALFIASLAILARRTTRSLLE
ncbi:MAG: choice-of-anchor tandem repeat NxxGxxAF-containing protein, partial [Pirellulales bacterium]